MTKKQLQSQIDDLKKEISSFKERWQMLKDYLKVEEEEYAVIVKPFSNFPYAWGYFPSEAVKKTRLIPIKKGKK